MSGPKSIFGTQKLRRGASKILQKLKLFKGQDLNLEELGSAEAQVARFVTFVRPTGAPQIIDLKAMRQSIRPQLTLIHTDHTHKPWVQRPQAEATSERSAAAALDDIADYEGYELLDDNDSDVDWSLLDLPENVYGKLANESRHSLI